MSLRAYATRRGVSVEAISKAVSDGRLKESVVRVNGAPKVADPDLADRELDASSRPRVDRAAATSKDMAEYYTSRSLREATRAEFEALKLAERRSELVPVKDVEARLAQVFTSCKTKLLGIAAGCRQEDPTLTPKQIEMIDRRVRRSLEDLTVGAD
jgi:phage terminase Nu1 subunit (DNA packaging protein)